MFWMWLRIGAQSFGGGVATQFLMRQTFVDERGLLTADEFNRYFAMCRFAPGINLAAVTILIGRHLDGWRGIAAGLIGLLLPSTAITILMTAAYASVKDSAIVQAAVRGIAPAVVALGFVLCGKIAAPVLFPGKKASTFGLPTGFLCMVVCGILLAWLNLPVFVIYALAGTAGAALTLAGASKQRGR